MRKYLAVKNALLVIIVTSIYYKSIFADISMITRIAGTIVIAIALMGTLQEVDKLFMEHIGYSEKEKSA